MPTPDRRRVGWLHSALVVFVLLAIVPAGQAAPNAIRTGGPSFSGDAKRAVVGANRSLVGRTYTVTDANGAVVLEGKLTRAPGKAAPWRSATIADLSSITAPGSYQIAVGKIRSKQPWVVVADGSAASTAVRHMLRFFSINADGNESSPAHGPSHLNDATIVGSSLNGQRVDLTGGWMDAGDMLKFTQTTAFTVVALLVAARLDPADAVPLQTAAGIGVRWLLKAHPAADVFVSQVGEIVADHDRDPSLGIDPGTDDQSSIPGIAMRQALTGIGLDSGGRTAAALALAAQVEPDVTARNQLITAASQWYVAAAQVDALAPPLPMDPYLSDTGLDDMSLGAIELYRATGDPQYLADALEWIDGHELSGTITWNDVGALAVAEMCGVLGMPVPSPAAAAKGCALLRSAAALGAEPATQRVLANPGGLGFGSTAENGGAGAVLALAAAAGFTDGRALAADSRDWVLGRNAWGRSFVAGLGPNPPVRVHSWTFRKGPDAFNGSVVGGPTTFQIMREQKLRIRRGPFDGPGGFYEDRDTNYVTSEVAIDYAASTLLLFAAMAPPTM